MSGMLPVVSLSICKAVGCPKGLPYENHQFSWKKIIFFEKCGWGCSPPQIWALVRILVQLQERPEAKVAHQRAEVERELVRVERELATGGQ